MKQKDNRSGGVRKAFPSHFERVVAEPHNGHRCLMRMTPFKYVVCADGTIISIMTGAGTRSKPRIDVGPYTHVEVLAQAGFGSETGRQPLKENTSESVPVDIVRQYIANHGGEAEPAIVPWPWDVARTT